MARLRVVNVSKNFGGLQALREVSFSVEEGETVSLIGPNGSGKTTLMNIISGIERLTKGEVLFNEQPIGNLGPHKRAALGIGRTFQLMRVFKHLSLLDNLLGGAHITTRVEAFDALFRRGLVRQEEAEARQRAMEALEIVGLDAGKANTVAGSLAAPEQRALELARALMSQPTLLLLDEPVGGLDGQQMQQWLKQIKLVQERFKTTILLVEHRMPLVMGISDKVVVLNFGQKIAEGPPHVIEKNQDVRRAYLGEKYVTG